MIVPKWIIKYIIYPAWGLFLTISAFAGAYNDIPQAWRDMRERGYLDFLVGFLSISAAFASSNLAVLAICLTIISFMFYILIVEPYRYARRQEAEFLESDDQ
ncbi:hypothetical protein [Rhizobium sp. P44RR-XXIV]|uniref:hypothetical protein n=1 Tax=Rhizobium sp. P44RR-XXIV TaxID=1921145 RepID=UPI0010AAAE17|nr:hypothetical protein [Rhizobium sp. P44RR-XXIV]TIX89162.1 hypothetical protein BSK43_021370 [Rhizobium sp. P44RR-XXIV]